MQQRTPRISIIMPAYNVEEYIEDALDSIFAQQPPAHEVIVVNDGSTDDTGNKIAKYQCQPTLHLITTKNRGLGPARNEGLRHATGDYIHFFDSDDVLDANFLSTMISIINADRSIDLILFSGQNFSDTYELTSSNDLLRPFAAKRLSGDSAVSQLVQAGTISPCAYLYVSKRSLWLDHQLSFKPVVHEDNCIFFPLLLKANNVFITQDILLHRRIRPKSIMSAGKAPAHAYGLLAAARTLADLYSESSHSPRTTRRAVRKRAIRTTQRYLRVCRKTGTATDTGKIRAIAYALRSPQLALSVSTRAINQSAKSRLATKQCNNG